MRCENCNETSPSPVSTVTFNQTLISLDDGTGELDTWVETTTVEQSVFLITVEFASILAVFVGSAYQDPAVYTIYAGRPDDDQMELTFDTPVPAGVKVIVLGIVEV